VIGKFAESLHFRHQAVTIGPLISVAAQPLRAQTSSESKRIEELERENAELKQEVDSLKNRRRAE
jgi:cell division protein FtsB